LCHVCTNYISRATSPVHIPAPCTIRKSSLTAMNAPDYTQPPPGSSGGIQQCWHTMPLAARKAIVEQHAEDMQSRMFFLAQANTTVNNPFSQQASLGRLERTSARHAIEDLESEGPDRQRRRIDSPGATWNPAFYQGKKLTQHASHVLFSTYLCCIIEMRHFMDVSRKCQ
jgi:hypothetical protein